LRALRGALTWIQAADILGIDPRSLRRWRARYAADEQLGLYDRRLLPSPRKAPIEQVQKILRLYHETYRSFNMRHFHHLIAFRGAARLPRPAPALELAVLALLCLAPAGGWRGAPAGGWRGASV
jgi:hypothetical protein